MSSCFVCLAPGSQCPCHSASIQPPTLSAHGPSPESLSLDPLWRSDQELQCIVSPSRPFTPRATGILSEIFMFPSREDRAWGEAQLVECLPSSVETWVLSPAPLRNRASWCTSIIPALGKLKHEDEKFQGHPQLHHEFRVNLAYVRTFSKRKRGLLRPGTNISAFPHSPMAFQIDHSPSLLDYKGRCMAPLDILGKKGRFGYSTQMEMQLSFLP